MVNKFIIILCASFLLASSVSSSFAQSGAGNKKELPKKSTSNHIYAGPFFGGYSLDSDKFETDTLYGVRIGYQIEGLNLASSLGIEGVFASVDTKSKQDEGSATGYMFRANAIYNLLQKRYVPFLSLGIGGLFLEDDANSDDTMIVVPGIGMKYFLSNYLDLRADFGYTLPFDPDKDGDWEYVLGLNYHFGQPRPIAPPPPADADHDGVPDRKDKCPDTPSGLTVDQFGCPPDTDGDGVPDGIDECPDSPPGAAVDSVGCNPDSDRDGVPDDKDVCPGTPAGIKVDEQGCVAPKDAALFSTPPVALAAVLTAAAVDAQGVEVSSPAVTPAPQIAVAQAPASAPVMAAQSAVFSVPDADVLVADAPQTVKPVQSLIIEFAFDKTYIKPQYHVPLQQLATRLKAEMDLEVTIEGHTDSLGKPNYNHRLGRLRAENVKSFLVNLGVAEQRILTQGFGSEHPLTDNNSEENRQKNRRAVVTILSAEMG